MDALTRAGAEGWQNLAWIRVDTDLDSLRSRDDFRKLLADLEASQSLNSPGLTPTPPAVGPGSATP